MQACRWAWVQPFPQRDGSRMLVIHAVNIAGDFQIDSDLRPVVDFYFDPQPIEKGRHHLSVAVVVELLSPQPFDGVVRNSVHCLIILEDLSWRVTRATTWVFQWIV